MIHTENHMQKRLTIVVGPEILRGGFSLTEMPAKLELKSKKR